MKWMKKHDIFLWIASILAAIVLWFVVITTENQERSANFYGIPIQFIGQQELLADHKLIMIGNTEPKVDLELHGSIEALMGVSQDNITIRADISRFEKPGEYKVSYDISAFDDVVVKSRTPGMITINLDEVIEKELPVSDIKIEGKVDSSLRFTEMKTDPAMVKISGASSEIQAAESVVISVNSVRLNSDYKGSLEYTIVDAEGKEVTGKTITKVDKRVTLEVTVEKTKSVPLILELKDGAGAPASSAQVRIEPQSVEIVGSAKQVNALESISIGEVSLDDFILSTEGTFEIVLPEGVTSTEELEEAHYFISFKDIDTAQLNVTNIDILNPPDNVVIEIESMLVVVTVRGPKESLKSLSPDDITLVANLDGLNIKNGRQIVSATAVIDESAEGVAALSDYSIIFNVSPPPMEAETAGG